MNNRNVPHPHIGSGYSRPGAIGQIDWSAHHQRILWLAANLDNIRPEGLTGDLSGLFKLRVGGYRVVYEILRDEQTIVIHFAGHRREVYRR